MNRVLVLNGPNLGRLGSREPGVYGTTTHAELTALCMRAGEELGMRVEVRQTDHEGELLGWLHEAADANRPVVLNGAALTHTSVGLGDACAMLTAPLIEVHISNVYKREEFRHHSYIADIAIVHVVGEGVTGYATAVERLISVITGQAEG
jgi:3-dehydroquinate dehydratase-2